MTHFLLAVQAAAAGVSGRVTDGASGEPLAAAVVWLSDLDRRAVTDGDGRYTLSDVPAGPHHVVVRRIGYASRTLHALVPGRGTIAIDIVLRAEPVTLGAVDAQAAVAVPGLDEADPAAPPGRVLSLAAIRNHPRLAEPDALEALGGGDVVLRPESPGGVHVRGGASDQVAYLLDGIPVFSPYHTAGRFSAWNPDALSGLRLDLASAEADALSGVVSASTRDPDAQILTQGTFSNTHARVTIDGPLGTRGAGFLYSRRLGFAGVPRPEAETSYLRGGSGDWLAKVDAPLLGGRARVLGFESESEIDAAAVADTTAPVARNAFAWWSRSAGGEWTRPLGAGEMNVRVWSAAASAGATWNAADSTVEHLTSDRRDVGLAGTLRLVSGRTSSVLGVRAYQSRTLYRTDVAEWRAHTPVAAVFADHARPMGPRAGWNLGLTASWAAGSAHLDPRAQLRWALARPVALTAGFARAHQFAQSLRNAESVVGTIFPADLYVGAGAPGVPVAVSDQVFAALEYRPTPALRVAGQAYARAFDGVVLVAPRQAGPFATSTFATGSGTARGATLDLGANSARYGLVLSYGLQDVRLEYGDTTYTPEHGASHTINGGVIVFPSPTFSVRLGATSQFGRRATAVSGALEWESCNLQDEGCEFAGSPAQRADALGATALPAYLRVDVGIRKHWHVRVAGRDGLIALYGTVTNVFGRSNVLTLVEDPATGRRDAIGMRSRGPLVVGIDWRY